MITGVGPTGIARAIELRSDGTGKNEAVAKVEQTRTQELPATQDSSSITTPAAELVAQGAPIDTAKVESIRAAIANGTYKIDAKAIAERMIALDLPAE